MGEIAALGTAFLWTFSSIFFSLSSNKIGSMPVNRIRLAFAVVYLLLAHWVLQGSPVPRQAGLDRWLWLGASAIMGLVIGDAFLMQTYVLVGTRIGTLMMALGPVVSAVLAWIFLGEVLVAKEIAGILVTVGGIILVVLERNTGTGSLDRKRYLLGMATGFIAALGQSSGMILAKKGLVGDFPAISGVMIRMTVASVTIWLMALMGRQVKFTFRLAQENPRTVAYIAAGATLGPFLGVWLSLIAVQTAYVGIASTIMALTPVLVLPILKWGFKEQISTRALIGTVTALAGVALLLL